jgi:5-formyltetrahydrofolate cyclo-ligase
MDIPQLRQHFRRLRRELGHDEQQAHARLVSAQVERYLGFRSGLKISAYIAFQGEISLAPWIEGNRHRHCIHLPRLYEPIEPRLRFAPLKDDTRWMRNRFGIPEPEAHWGKTIAAQHLDIMLVPLVAFDRQGHRLGMGGGYYDRSMGFRGQRKHWRKPLLVGVAHSQQEHSALPQQPWDAALDVIITEREIIRPR